MTGLKFESRTRTLTNLKNPSVSAMGISFIHARDCTCKGIMVFAAKKNLFDLVVPRQYIGLQQEGVMHSLSFIPTRTLKII